MKIWLPLKKTDFFIWSLQSMFDDGDVRGRRIGVTVDGVFRLEEVGKPVERCGGPRFGYIAEG